MEYKEARVEWYTKMRYKVENKYTLKTLFQGLYCWYLKSMH